MPSTIICPSHFSFKYCVFGKFFIFYFLINLNGDWNIKLKNIDLLSLKYQRGMTLVDEIVCIFLKKRKAASGRPRENLYWIRALRRWRGRMIGFVTSEKRRQRFSGV